MLYFDQNNEYRFIPKIVWLRVNSCCVSIFVRCLYLVTEYWQQLVCIFVYNCFCIHSQLRLFWNISRKLQDICFISTNRYFSLRPEREAHVTLKRDVIFLSLSNPHKFDQNVLFLTNLLYLLKIKGTFTINF